MIILICEKGGAALAPPRVSGLPQTPFYILNETNESTTLFSFIVTDEGPVTVTPSDENTRNIAVAEAQEIKPASSPPQFNVTVRTIKPLDRDTGTHGQSLYTMKFNIQDSEGNTVSVPGVYIQVNDINDNPPVFTNRPYRWYINEKPFNKTAVFNSIGAYDYDSGQNSRLTYSMTSLSAINDFNSHFHIAPDTGEIKLLKELDYEENSYYQFTVMVQDHGNPPLNDTADLIIRVNDVQDTPTFFKANLYRANINENVQMNTSVIQVNARDGDIGVSNEVSYEIVLGPCSSLFQIDSVGRISTKTILEIDDLPETRICQLTVQAFEVVPGLESATDETRSTTDVWITILDAHEENPANCNNNGNIKYISLTTMWVSILVGNVLRLLN